MNILTPAQLVKKYPVVSRSLIYAACLSGTLPHYRLTAKQGRRGKYAIKEDDFLAWLETNRRESGTVKDDEQLTYLG